MISDWVENILMTLYFSHMFIPEVGAWSHLNFDLSLLYK